MRYASKAIRITPRGIATPSAIVIICLEEEASEGETTAGVIVVVGVLAAVGGMEVEEV